MCWPRGGLRRAPLAAGVDVWTYQDAVLQSQQLHYLSREGRYRSFDGVITIPSIFNLCGLTKWTLFGPAGAGVPDGGATAVLLGVALGMLGICRRFTAGLTVNPNSSGNCRKY